MGIFFLPCVIVRGLLNEPPNHGAPCELHRVHHVRLNHVVDGLRGFAVIFRGVTDAYILFQLLAHIVFSF